MTPRRDDWAGGYPEPMDPEREELPGGGVGFSDLIAILRRRWLTALLILSTSLGVGTWLARAAPPVFVAESVVQKRTEAMITGVSGLGGGGGGIASDLEVLRSRALLGEVVDSLGLRYRERSLSVAIPPIVAEARLDATAAPFTVQIQGGGRAQVSFANGQVRDVQGGEWVEGPGVRALLSLLPDTPTTVEVALVPRDAAIDALRSAMSVSQSGATNVIRIRITDRSPIRAARIADQVAFAFRDNADRVARESALRRREFLQGQIDLLGDSVTTSQEQLTRFQADRNRFNPSGDGAAALQEQQGAEQELRGLLAEQQTLRSLSTLLRSPDSRGSAGLERIIFLSEGVLPSGRGLYERLSGLEAQRRTLTASRFGYREDGATVDVINAQIDAVTEQLIRVAEESATVLDARIADAQARVRSAAQRVASLPVEVTELGRLQESAGAVRGTYNLLLSNLYDAQISEAIARGNVEILDPAVIPGSPVPTQERRTVLFGALVGLFGALLGAVARDRLDNTVLRAGDAEDASGLPLLAMVPRGRFKQRGDRKSTKRSKRGRGRIAPGGPEELLFPPGTARSGKKSGLGASREAFHSLRSALHFVREERPKVLLVVSQGPHEGKTFVAANLAACLASAEGPVLLMDGDLRRPRAHRIMGIAPKPGLTDVLVGEAPREEAIIPLVPDQLFGLPAGTTSATPQHFYEGEGFRALLDQWKGEYNWIIIDSAPVLAVSEVLRLATMVDGVLLVARMGETPRRGLRTAADRLRSVKAPVLGVIVNDVPAREGYSAYGYGYGYSYGGYYYAYHSYQYDSVSER